MVLPHSQFEPVCRCFGNPVIDIGFKLELRRIIPIVKWIPVAVKIKVGYVVSTKIVFIGILLPYRCPVLGELTMGEFYGFSNHNLLGSPLHGKRLHDRSRKPYLHLLLSFQCLKGYLA